MTTTARSTRASSNEVPQPDPSRRQPLPVNAWRVQADGALCRTLLGACSPRCQWGREQPPGLDGVSTPTPARRVAHAPMSLPECSRILAVICTPNERACCHVRTGFRSLSERAALLNDHSRQKSAITMRRIELCAASLKALAALDPAGCGLDDASAQLEVALM
jgi:hypothetical protein